MNLKQYLEKNRIDPVAFSLDVRVGISSIYRYMRGSHCHRNTAIRIEKATKGAVTVEEMMGIQE